MISPGPGRSCSCTSGFSGAGLRLDEHERAGLIRSEIALGPGVPDSAEALRLAAAPATSATLPSPPFVPTSITVAERMLALAGVTAADLVCDLGSGDGRVPILAAKNFGARGRGVERDPALVATARAAAAAQGVSERVEFICDDLFTGSLGDVSVLSLYLLPALQEPVHQRLLPRLRSGTRVLSHDYLFPHWPPERSELIRDGPARMAQIYLWRIP